MMAFCSDRKNKVAFYIVLVSLLIRTCHQTEVNDLSLKSQHFVTAVSDEQTSTVDKLDLIRQLGRSLFLAWNFGCESEIEGRTFGRIRVMRQIMLPMAFLGGFLTAVIIAIKKISIVNMLLISGVLILNLAFMFGKIMVSKALWFHKLSSQQNHHHDHWQHSLSSPHFSSYGSSLLDRVDDLPYAQPAFTSQFSGQNYNQIPSYFISPPQQQYPTYYGSQPLALQPQTSLPVNMQYNRLQKQLTSSTLNQPNSSMSPAEMDKLLTDTLAKLSANKSNSPISRFKRKSSASGFSNRRYINLLRPFR